MAVTMNEKQKNCGHEEIRRVVTKGLEWDGEECCVGHLDVPEQCWCCPDCNKYVSYEERQEIKFEVGMV